MRGRIIRIVGKDRIIHCPYCEATFNTPEEKSEHIQVFHPNYGEAQE